MNAFSYVAFAAIILLASCATRPTSSHAPRQVAVEQILSSPDMFDGSCVVVKGFLLFPMVGDIAIYQTQPQYLHGSPEPSIRLDLDPNTRDLNPFQLKRCVVEGKFHASRAPGVRGQIGEITRIELAP